MRQLRLQADLSQERLALLASLDRSYLGLIERGQRNITLGNIEKISRALHVSLATLMEGV